MRDIFDNAQVLDSLINGDATEVTGRTGKELKSIAYLQGVLTSLDVGSFTFADTIAGLAGTTDGQYFRTPDPAGEAAFIYYANNSGAADEVAKTVSASSLQFIDGQGFHFTDTEGFQYGALTIGENGPKLSGINEVGLDDIRLLVSGKNLLAFRDSEGFSVDFTVLLSQVADLERMNPQGVTFSKTQDADIKIGDSEGFEFSVRKSDDNQKKSVEQSNQRIAALESDGNAAAFIPLQLESAAQAAMQDNFGRFNPLVTQMRKGLNIFIIFGQSLSVGAQSYTAVTRAASTQGNLMLGNSPRGQHSEMTTDINFDALGGNVYNPLIECRQANDGTIITDSTDAGSGEFFGETMLSGLLESVKWLHNRSVGEINDESVVLAGSCVGAAGSSIEKLSKGAAENYYNRYLTCLAGHMEAAKAAGYTDVQVAGIMYIQGENNAWSDTADYQAKLLTLKGNLQTDAMTATGQADTPAFFLYQIGGTYQPDEMSLTSGAPMAYMNIVRENPDVFFVGNEFGYPNVGAHMYANSYRWFASRAAKVVFGTLTGFRHREFRPDDAVYSGDAVYLSFRVPSPPVTSRDFYILNQATNTGDMGITVTDENGSLSGNDLTVSIHSPYVLKIIPARSLSGDISVSVGDKTHSGCNSIADSDDQLSLFTWKYYGDSGQREEENIPALLNQPYPMFNRSANYFINVRKI
ncbi:MULTISPECIES: hypothetical protein [unclassified Tatumella]|uniref:hypothetical protein n=1 Tax=unclassified Tatumella TaxID=2649542 RepID=UPI001BB031E4|nr:MULTISPECIES: hypothetical protein [unclassified Tatumella]MBS0878007.1 hypothetical protein [Tatumella sp. JGM82]MBS0891270.1 hypothetical protein [Tatumella sp. JGM94]MBS0902649.1 hypothetical protein [Tatumella sp. JGM100]